MNMSFSSVEDILCLYYDYSKRKVLADSCNTSKPFICMNPILGINEFVHIQFVAIMVRILELLKKKVNKSSILTISSSFWQKCTLSVPQNEK